MAERSPNAGAVSVESLALKVPGQNAAFGRRVAERAVALVAERLPPGARGELGALKLRVRVRGGSEAEMSESIANALLGALSRKGA